MPSPGLLGVPHGHVSTSFSACAQLGERANGRGGLEWVQATTRHALDRRGSAAAETFPDMSSDGRQGVLREKPTAPMAERSDPLHTVRAHTAVLTPRSGDTARARGASAKRRHQRSAVAEEMERFCMADGHREPLRRRDGGRVEGALRWWPRAMCAGRQMYTEAGRAVRSADRSRGARARGR